jgi:hypothetical protein
MIANAPENPRKRTAQRYLILLILSILLGEPCCEGLLCEGLCGSVGEGLCGSVVAKRPLDPSLWMGSKWRK